jgi:hypothetical protein
VEVVQVAQVRRLTVDLPARPPRGGGKASRIGEMAPIRTWLEMGGCGNGAHGELEGDQRDQEKVANWLKQ